MALSTYQKIFDDRKRRVRSVAFLKRLDAGAHHHRHRHKKYCHEAQLRSHPGPRRLALRAAYGQAMHWFFIAALIMVGLCLLLWLLCLAAPYFPKPLPPSRFPVFGIVGLA